MFYKSLIILILQLMVKRIKSEDEIKVCLDQLGCLQGTEMPGYRSDKFEAFLGVPYAKPPIRELRFHNPVPGEAWEGVLSATEAKADCIQKNYLLPGWPISGSEDCLYLNLYRPKGSGDKHLPVIFYIYGGGLFSGTSHPSVMGPEYFMDTQEVILVAVTYRLGPFGFLSSGCAEIPGNFGFKDQLLAMKWVQENIKSFGGNPDEVTLFGHSSGASSAHVHMLNPKTKDLFKRAILSSGNALGPYINILDNPREQLYTVASAAGIESPDSLSTKDLADKLRHTDANAILNAGNSFKFWFNHALFNYRPVIEDSILESSYIIESPYETVQKGNFVVRPWLTGLVSYRGESAPLSLNIYNNQSLRAEFNQNFDDMILKLLEFKNPEILKTLIDEYMQGMHELNEHTGDGFFELCSDYYFYYPVYKTIRHYFDYAEVKENPVFIYKFSYHGPYTYVPIYTGGSTNKYDVVHFDDLLYQFRQSAYFPDFEKQSHDAELVKDFVNILVEFAKTGTPLHYDDIGSCTKEQMLTSGESNMCKYLEFVNADDGYKRVINSAFNMKRMHLWDELMKQ